MSVPLPRALLMPESGHANDNARSVRVVARCVEGNGRSVRALLTAMLYTGLGIGVFNIAYIC